MTGRKTCNSRPVDIRGVQFVPDTGVRYCPNGGMDEPRPPGSCPPVQLKPISSAGQPKDVLLMSCCCDSLILGCDGRKMGSMPRSAKGAMATGPAMVMRYSRLPMTLKSPPGVVSCWYGIGMLMQLVAHVPLELTPTGKLGLAGTNAPVGFRRATDWALG